MLEDKEVEKNSPSNCSRTLVTLQLHLEQSLSSPTLATMHGGPAKFSAEANIGSHNTLLGPVNLVTSTPKI